MRRHASPLLSSIALLAACHSGRTMPGPASDVVSAAGTATAIIRDASGNQLGRLLVSETAAGLAVTGTLTGLTPGVHGIHLHTVGRCDAPAFTTAGGHWNPTTHAHGFDNPQGPHQGDMRNVTADAAGAASVSTSTMGGSLMGAGGLLDADGAAIVVHAAADDYRTDPAGNSGARIACGVIMR